MIPGEMFIQDGEIELKPGRKTVTLSVTNTGDRPIQVGSHYHFFETNPALNSTARRRAACGSTSRPAPRCGSSQGRPATSRWSRSPESARSTGFARTSWKAEVTDDGDNKQSVEEYKSCKQHIVEDIKWMDQLEVYTVGAVAAVYVFVFSES